MNPSLLTKWDFFFSLPIPFSLRISRELSKQQSSPSVDRNCTDSQLKTSWFYFLCVFRKLHLAITCTGFYYLFNFSSLHILIMVHCEMNHSKYVNVPMKLGSAMWLAFSDTWVEVKLSSPSYKYHLFLFTHLKLWHPLWEEKASSNHWP